MDIEQRLREFLSGLDAGNSPITWQNKDFLIEGIVKSNIREIAQLPTVQLLEVGPAEYIVLRNKVQKYDYEDYKNRKIQFITGEDLELERDEQRKHETASAEDKSLLPDMKFIQKSNLLNELVRKKNFKTHSVFCNDVMFG